MLVTREFTFDAAHNLTNYHGKCEDLHGHTYKLAVTLDGKVQDNGLVIDFAVLKKIVNKHVIEKLDHKYLNDIFDNSSVEKVAIWIWDQLKDFNELLKEEADDPNLDPETIAVRLYEVKLWESPGSYVTYNGK